MTATDITLIVVSKLTAFESEAEAWKTDYEQAMRVFDCQDLVARVVDLYYVIDRLNRSVVDDIVDGRIDYDEAMDGLIKTLCARWITLARDIRNSFSILRFKQDGYTIDKEGELTKCIKVAQDSQLNNFDDYANKLASEMKIPLELVDKFQTPMRLWPE